MVLNDASPQSGDFNPPYQNGPRGHLPIPGYPLVFKTEYVCRPDLFTLYFGFFGQRNWLHKNGGNIRDRIDSCKDMINRVPTQEELDAFVEHGSKYTYHSRMGIPYFGALGAAYAYWRVRNSGTIAHLVPGLQPGTRPTPAQVLAAVKLYATIEPANFRYALARASVVWFVWMAAGGIITGSWAVFSDLRKSMSDPRLKQFFVELRNKDPEEVRKRKVQRVVEKSKAAREAAERRAQGLPPVEVGMDQGHEHDQGGGAYGSFDSYSSSSARESVPSASPEKPADLPDWNRRSYGDSSSPEKATDFFESDDMSPVAAEYRSDGGSQGSAWERIRQQAGPQRGQDSGVGSAGNRGSSMPDNDRQQRDRSQAEFDRLLEAERNMAGDSEGGQKKGWGRWN